MNRSTNNLSDIKKLIEKRRRYPVGKFTFYDDRLIGRLHNSPIDFDKEVFVGSSVFLSLDRIPDLELLTRQYQEKIESLEYKFGELKKAKNLKKQQMTNEGRPYKEEKKREEIEMEAALDVLIIEKSWVSKRLKKLEIQEQGNDDQQRLAKMKRVGLGRNESINFNTSRGHISYMHVEPVDGGGICIVDDLSPYNGISLFDLREFVIPIYQLEVNRIYEKKLKEWKGNGKEGAAPTTHKIHPPWPSWPKGIRNYLEKK